MLDKLRNSSVAQLIKDRNDGTKLPTYPSAQWWRNATEDEQAEIKEIVERTMSWSIYERDMKAHWPKR